MVRSGLRDLKEEIKKTNENEKETEILIEIENIVEKILEFNNQNQRGQGLKIVAPDQMLSTYRKN